MSNNEPQNIEYRSKVLYLFDVSGQFSRHAREGGHPVYSEPNFLDSCLRRNDGLYRNKLPDCSFILGLGSNIGRGYFVGWVEHPDIFCWVSFLYPTYLPTIFVLSAKPNKMAYKRQSEAIPSFVIRYSAVLRIAFIQSIFCISLKMTCCKIDKF